MVKKEPLFDYQKVSISLRESSGIDKYVSGRQRKFTYEGFDIELTPAKKDLYYLVQQGKFDSSLLTPEASDEQLLTTFRKDFGKGVRNIINGLKKTYFLDQTYISVIKRTEVQKEFLVLDLLNDPLHYFMDMQKSDFKTIFAQDASTLGQALFLMIDIKKGSLNSTKRYMSGSSLYNAVVKLKQIYDLADKYKIYDFEKKELLV